MRTKVSEKIATLRQNTGGTLFICGLAALVAISAGSSVTPTLEWTVFMVLLIESSSQ